MIGGGILFAIGHFSTLRWIFEESVLLTCLGFLIPAVPLIYSFIHRKEHAGEFWCQMIGLIATTAGFFIYRGLS
jgi:hypothetical protein